MNIILDNKQRDKYKSVIDELFYLCPEMMSRKINGANVQQAFMFDTVRNLSNKNSKLLCIGSFEDTACESLMKLGYNITAIDPVINTNLNDFFNKSKEKYDLIFSTSVIEHVEDDELFIEQICKLLKNGGYGVLTCDFNDNYKNGDGKPGEDFRLYTKKDLLKRLNSVLNNNDCKIIGDVDYDSLPDFQYGIYKYSFATYNFIKNE